MTNTDTSTAENVEAIWVNKSSKTGFQVMGCGSHFHGENMRLYVSMDVLNAAITRAEQAEAALKATLEREAETHSRLSEIYVKHTGNDFVNVEVALDDALDELSACKELGGCGYWRDRSKVREADLDAALARVAELEAERDAALDMMAAQPMALSKALRKLGHLVPISVVSKALRADLAGEEPKP